MPQNQPRATRSIVSPSRSTAPSSSHGADEGMWRADPIGPQGPMQVSLAAAIDVGGGDRFDAEQNRAMGRAYLALLYHRYGDWPDAIAAYNWGIGNLESWVKAGRPANGSVSGVASYLDRVLHDSGVCAGLSAHANATEGGRTFRLLRPRGLEGNHRRSSDSVDSCDEALLHPARQCHGACCAECANPIDVAPISPSQR